MQIFSTQQITQEINDLRDLVHGRSMLANTDDSLMPNDVAENHRRNNCL